MAQVRQTVADALQWVKGELDQSIVRVRQDIEGYIEAPADRLSLQRAIVELHQIRGTLIMVRCHGAAFLAEEMKNAVQDLLQTEDGKLPEAALESLLGASLQLSDYIDLLSTGVNDCALVFQPAINELRVARGKGVFGESALFAHHLAIESPQPPLPDLRQRAAGQIQPLARKLLPAYQVSLLQWIKDYDIDLNLKRLGKIAEHVSGTTRHTDVYQMWWLYAAVCEGLLSKGIEPALEVKRLFGQAGQQLKQLAEQGEEGSIQVPSDITYTLLYLVGRSTVAGPRTKAVRATYSLDELLPPAEDLDEIRTRLRGPNTHLMERLSEALKQDIATVKDTIDLVVRGGGKTAVELAETISTVDRIADTLAMLGLHMLQRVVMNQTKLIEQLRDSGSTDEKAWMEVAVALLRVEHSLDDALFRQIRQQGDKAAAKDKKDEEEVTPSADLHGGEAAIWREALVNVARIKTLIKEYIDRGEHALMAEASRQMNEIAAGFDIQGRERAADMGRRLRDFLQSSAAEVVRTDMERSGRLADAIVNIEYYLEALQQRHPHAGNLEDNVAQCVEALNIAQRRAIPVEQALQQKMASVRPQTAPKAAPAKPKAGPEVDPEIRAVFLEEAEEVLGQLQVDQQRWMKDIENMEVLRDIRRAFHTLKGSGRMVGATIIGEFGWAHENMLNKCLEGAIAVGNLVIEAIRDAVALLPDLIADLQDGSGNEAIAQKAEELIERAGTASRGEMGSDAELYQIFRLDAINKLNEIQNFLKQAGPEFTPLRLDAHVIRAFHTMKGSGEAVGAMKLSQLSSGLEHLTESVRNADRALSTDELKLIQDSVNAMNTLLAWMAGEIPVEPELKVLFGRLHDLQQAIPSAATEAATDHELVIVFTDEACDILDRAQDSLKAWRQSPSDQHHPRTLKGLFHNLKGSARTAQAGTIGEVSDALEGRITPFEDGRSVPSTALLDCIDHVVEALYNLLDRYRHGERALPVTELMSQIESVGDGQTGAPVRAAPPPPEVRAPPPPSPEPVAVAPELSPEPAPVLAAASPAQKEPLLSLSEPPSAAADEEIIEMPPPPEEPDDGLSRSWGREAEAEFNLQFEAEPSTAPEPPPPAQVATPEPIQPPARTPVAPAPVQIAGQYGSDISSVDPEMLEIFTSEAQELVEGIDTQLAQWEADPAAASPARELLRSLHTLKGSARMTSLASMGDLSHELETQISAAEQRRRPADAKFFAGLRNAVDAMHGMLDSINRGNVRMPDIRELLADLRGDSASMQTSVQPTAGVKPAEAARPLPPVAAPPPPPPPMARPPVSPVMAPMLPTPPPVVSAPPPPPPRIVAPPPPMVAPPIVPPPTPATPPVVRTPEPVEEQPEQYMPFVETAPTVRAPVDTGPWAPQLFWQPEQSEAVRAQQFETARVPVGQLDSMLNEAGEISIYSSRLEQQNTSFQYQLSELMQTTGRIRDQIRKLDFETQAQIQSVKEGARQTDSGTRYEEFDPLEMDRYSRLQEMSRALAESMTDLESLHGYLDELRSQNEMLLLQQARVNSGLHQRLMRSLMVPFSRQVQRLERIVRQTAQEYGKQARIEFSGVESELDRKVLERMVPPLEHLLRNAIVHGIESPAERKLIGKPEAGVVAVRLSRDGPQLVIDVSDDGRGLNLEGIRKKAIAIGMVAANAPLSESDIVQFIYEPGFTTASEVTQVAGRGVGMDVVNAEIKQLGGNIETRTVTSQGAHFIIRLPLSLTITQALLVHVADEMYALPMNTIEGIARIDRGEVLNYCREDGPSFAYGGQDYRVRQMAEMLHLQAMVTSEGEKTVPMLLIRAGDHRIALVIDEVLGTREVVVKSVGLQVSSVAGVTGATVLADGRVVVILDAPTLVQARLRRTFTAEVRRVVADEAEDERPLVLVVDDSITMRRVAERTLLRNGFRVSTAKDGMDALGKLQIEFPAVVLLDIEMPRIDGFELATYMRNSEKLSKVPIIMITSRSGEKHRARAEQIGVNRYMIKPYQEDELIKSINELLVRTG